VRHALGAGGNLDTPGALLPAATGRTGVGGEAGVVHLGVTRQAAAQLVDELAAKGYVGRRPHPGDARARLVTLTPKGWACIQAAEAAMTDTIRPWAAALGEQRLLALTGDLLRLAPDGPLRPVR
jgi:hypothetical protein